MIKSDIGSIGLNIKKLVLLVKEWRDKKANPASFFSSKFDAVYNGVVDWCMENDIEIELGCHHSLQQTLSETFQ
jgi:hypothetical protein